MTMTPVTLTSGVMTQEGKSVALVAVQGYAKYSVPVAYWPELLNDSTTGTPPGYGPTLGAKWIAKEAAVQAPGLVTEGLKKRQDRLAALPPIPAEGEDPDAAERATLQQEITNLTALKAIVDADAVPRIDDFYNALLALIGPADPRIEQYHKEWNAAKAPFGSPALPTTI